MAIDMKDVIAEAARKLLMDKNIKKLTVKDIVEECNITRQTFYYHFEGIPDLIRWILERGTREVMKEADLQESPEEKLRFFFLTAVNAIPYIKKSMQTNYKEEIEALLTKQFYHLFEQIADENQMYRECMPWQRKLILRYHSLAVMGLLREWTDEDTKNLDEIVRDIYPLITSDVR